MPRMSNESLLDAALENPATAGFAMFDVDLGGTVTPNGELVFPEFEGQYTPLWTISQNTETGEDTITQKEALRLVASQERVDRVSELAEKVANGTPLFEEKEAPPHDEWEHFWGGSSPSECGYVR